MEERKIRVLHVVSGLDLSSGGPARSVVHLTNGLAESGQVEVSLLFGAFKSGRVLNSHRAVIRIVCEQKSFLDRFLALSVLRFLRTVALNQHYDLVHIHGVWNLASHHAARAARHAGVPYIIQPRGMLEPWSFQFKRFKKRLAYGAYLRNDLFKASGFICTSDMEMKNLERLGLNKPTVSIPNGVERQVNTPNYIQQYSNKTIIFLSRIHQKKGLELLIESWSQAAPPNWELKIFGGGDSVYIDEIRKLIKLRGVGDTLMYHGEVYGLKRTLAFSTATLFILPSFSENFGMVVAEALSFGLPVITTTGTPWSVLNESGAGWCVEPNIDSLTKVFNQISKMNFELYKSKAEKAFLLSREYDWNDVSLRVCQYYKSLI